MFVRATYDRENRTVHYFDEAGNETLYIGGSFAWRMSNPGNLTKPSSYVMLGAIGYAQRTSTSKGLFVIFADRETGKAAHKRVLKQVYGDKSIRGMITAYAPPNENDTEGYIDFVKKKAGVASTDVVGELSDDKFDAVVRAMEQKEGWVPGVIKPLGKPVQVQMLDRLNQPFSRQAMQLKGQQGSVQVQTNANGELPWIYSGLLGPTIDIAYTRGQSSATNAEHVGQLAAASASGSVTINAPYHLVPTRPRQHKSEAPPPARVHIVQPGETLSGIAAKYGTTAQAMASANGLKDLNHIYARQHLAIPATDSSGAAAHASPPASATAPSAKTDASSAPARTGASSASPSVTPAKTGTSAVPASTAPAKTSAPASHAPAAKPAATGSGPAAVVHQHAPSGHPQTVVSSPTHELSGPAWCARYPGSSSLNSLNASFKAAASAFIDAMRAAHFTVKVNAALRPIQRSYLMYHAFEIAKGRESPDKVPPWDGVNIDWVHRKPDGSMDLEASIKAAKAMCAGYQINIHSAKQAVGRPGKSRHNFGAAVDMNISGYVGKTMKDASGHDVKINSFADLKHVGDGYGVTYFPKENMHWSDTGH